MSRFRFRLQDLMQLAEAREKEQATQLARAQQAAAMARLHAETLNALRAAGSEQIAAAHGRGTAAGSIQQMSLILEQLERHHAAAASVLSSAEAEVARCRAAYTTVAQERQVLDKLRERRHEAWRIEQAQHEQKQMDELAATRHGKSKGPTGGSGTS